MTGPETSLSVTRDQRRAADPRSSVWVAASAGSGKTKALTDRVLRLLLGGAAPERLLCLTFTKAAAAEMRARLNRRLGEWTMQSDGDLDAALESLSGDQPDAALRAPQHLALPFTIPDLFEIGFFSPFGLVRWSLDRPEFAHSGIDIPLREGAPSTR